MTRHEDLIRGSHVNWSVQRAAPLNRYRGNKKWLAHHRKENRWGMVSRSLLYKVKIPQAMFSTCQFASTWRGKSVEQTMKKKLAETQEASTSNGITTLRHSSRNLC